MKYDHNCLLCSPFKRGFIVIESFGNAVITILTWVDTINLIVVEYFGNASVHFPRTQKNWNWLLGFLQSSLNLLCLPSEHMLRLQKSNTNCVFATQKLHISLAPPLSSRKNYVEIEINTRQCSHCLFQCFCSVAAGKTDAKVKQANAEKWISSSLEPILLNA